VPGVGSAAGALSVGHDSGHRNDGALGLSAEAVVSRLKSG
jgi:hypothetical protein